MHHIWESSPGPQVLSIDREDNGVVHLFITQFSETKRDIIFCIQVQEPHGNNCMAARDANYQPLSVAAILGVQVDNILVSYHRKVCIFK